MANLFSIFNRDPKKMPGQGLASPDYNAEATKGEYNQLLDLFKTGLEQYGPGIAGGQLKSLRALLTGTGDQPGVGRSYLDAIRLADPESAGLMDQLTSTATSELALDNQLDPNQLRLVEQGSRASAAARGMGYGPSDAFAEQFAKLGYGDALRDKRRQAALTLQQLRQSLAAKPIDWATQTATSQSPEQGMWQSLLTSYGNNQSNARTQAELETKIGMDQADKWNDWFKVAAAAI